MKMKIIYEVGDRVELVNSEYLPELLGVTGTVDKVTHHEVDDGQSVSFVMDNPPRDRAPGHRLIASSADLKYLEPEVPEDITAELFARLSSLKSGDRADGHTMKKALDFVANLDDFFNSDTHPEINRPVVELKKKLITILKGGDA